MTRGDALWVKQGSELFEGLLIDPAFEVDHLPQRVPVTYPAPGVELRFDAPVQAEGILAAIHPQQEPSLFLADTDGSAVAPDETLGETIAQPATGGAQQGHLVGPQADLLLEFTEQRLNRRFLSLYAALRKLPGILTHTPAPKETALGVAQNDAHVGSKTFRVYQGGSP